MIGHLVIDGKRIPFEDGETIMDAATAAGIYIPHLCHQSGYSPHGSCRVCCVRLNDRLVPACTTRASDGDVIENESTEINAYRRQLLELLFVEGNHVCPACELSGACQLQATAYHCGMLAPEYHYLYPLRTIDASHPDFIIDFNRCILCELCVRASRDVDGKSIFTISGRGIASHLVINTESGELGDSDFTTEDAAAIVCPVGAILPKHRGYEIPLGQRRYDLHPVSVLRSEAGEQTGKDDD